MPVFKQYTESSYKWGIWKASESLEELLALLPHKEKYEEGIGKFTAVSRKLEWLAVRVLLYTMLGEGRNNTIIPTADPIWQTALFPSVFHIPKVM